MADINNCTFTGTVSRRYEPSGNGPLKLGLEVTNEFQKRDQTTGTSRLFLDVTVWGKLAEGCRLAEGDRCCVVGELASDSYDKDGAKVWKTVLKASRIGALDGGTVRRTAAAPRSDADDSADPW